MKSHGFDSWHSWKMAAAAASVMFTSWGFLMGVRPYLFVALMKENGGTREQNSWPFVLPFAMLVFAAPVMIPLGKRFALRPIVLTGVVLASISCSACFFSTNYYFMVVFFGCLQGVGIVLAIGLLTFLYPTSFKKYRSTASGLVLLTPQMGSFISSYVGVYILEEYGLRGTLLIMGAVSLHGVLGAAVLVQYNGLGIRPSSPNREKQNHVKHQARLRVVTSQTGLRSPETSRNEIVREPILEENAIQSGTLLEAAMLVPSKTCPIRSKCNNTDEVDAGKEIHIKSGISERNDIKSLEKVLPEGRQNKVMWNKDDDIVCQTQEPTQSDSKNMQETKAFWRKNTGLRSVLTNPYFLLTVFSQQIISSVYMDLGVVIVDYVNDKGLPLEKGFYMFPVCTAGVVFSRLALGWLADKNYVSKFSYLAIGTGVLAGPVFVVTLVSGFEILIFCIGIIGILYGNLYTLSQALYGEFLPQQVVYIGVAISSSLNGVSSILTPFVIGAFRDNVGSYDNMFRMKAGLLVICSCLWTIASIRWRRRSVSTTPEV